MNAEATSSAVTKSITLEQAIEDAFRIWTEEIHLWWPYSHSISKDPNTRVFIEGKVGGRFFERTSTGIEHDWGKVLVWQPFTYFAYAWYLGSGQQLPTRVDVTFVPLFEKRTRVDIVHQGPELIGALWGVNQDRYQAGWESVLPEFGLLCQQS